MHTLASFKSKFAIRLSVVLVAVVGCLLGWTVGQAPGPVTASENDRVLSPYVSAWMASSQPPLDSGISHDGFTKQTVRQIIHVHHEGSSVRIAIANTYGTTPLQLGAATVALPKSAGALVPGTTSPLTFDGQRAAVIPAGSRMLSDPVAMKVNADTDLAVDLYFPAPTGPITWHALARQDTYLTNPGEGDKTGQTVAFATTTQSFFALDEVQVSDRKDPGTVVMLGDSITDGEASTVNANKRLPDDLSRRLNAIHGKHVVAAAISGNVLLQDYLPGGQNLLARLDRDVLAKPDVTDVIFLAGINDIGGFKNFDANAILTGMRQVVTRAHTQNIRVYGGTLLPFEGSLPGFEYYTPAGEQTRQTVNTAIRAGRVFDGVIDFDKVMRDPTHPIRLRPEFDSGDHLHPNDRGYQAMADAIDIRPFRH
jgi:lysophospholipase L1-like esterase